jgi:DNA repair exonuclease SbcCD nuclease subunit
MTVRLLQTGDWHLGCPFRQIPGDPGAALRERRVAAVREIAALATARRVDAVLVAGDVLDSQHVDEQGLRRALAALAGFAGPWILLPGNHDAALTESVWTRARRIGLPEGVMVAERAEPVAIAGGRAVVLPAPLRARRTPDDLTAWMDAVETTPGAVRIGLAHGVVEGLHPEPEAASNPIARDRVASARLDWLALGDRHGTLEVAPRCWYAGSPEPDGFRYQGAGNVLLVELDGPGASPRVETVPVAHYRWQALALELVPLPAAELVARLDGRLGELGPPERAVVRLELAGSVDLTGRRALDAALERWRALLHHLEVDEEGLLLQPGLAELGALDDGGPLGACARRLAEAALSGPETERATAALALRLLWQERARLEAA